MQSAEIQALRDKHYNASVVDIRPVNQGLWSLRVRPDKGVTPFLPGQYTTLGLGIWEARVQKSPEEILKEGDEKKLLRRAYSMSHPVLNADSQLCRESEIDFYEFYINLVQVESDKPLSPMLTTRIFQLKVGDRLAVGPKVTGHYILEGIRESDQILFFATGTGEAPHNAMIWELLRRGHQGKILHSVTTRNYSDQGYKKIHEKLEKQFPNYKTIFLATREPDAEKIYPQDLIERGILHEKAGIKIDPANTHVFLCGNPALIGRPTEENGKKVYPKPKGMIEVLEERGFAIHTPTHPGNIHFEAYW